MKRKTTKSLFALLLLFFPLVCKSAFYGFTFSDILRGSEPEDLRGLQLTFIYDPHKFMWRQFNIYFDATFSHFWIPGYNYYSSLNIFSLAPVIRYTFDHWSWIHPYIDISIGAAYLDKTHLDDRNFGIHFTFQDRFGAGVYFGQMQQLSLGLHVVHYSNAHFSSHNSGITAPIVLDIGYRIQ